MISDSPVITSQVFRVTGARHIDDSVVNESPGICSVHSFRNLGEYGVSTQISEENLNQVLILRVSRYFYVSFYYSFISF